MTTAGSSLRQNQGFGAKTWGEETRLRAYHSHRVEGVIRSNHGASDPENLSTRLKKNGGEGVSKPHPRCEFFVWLLQPQHNLSSWIS
jgi:hypothetical protein